MGNKNNAVLLKIEQGFLLKPYTAPYTRKDGGGHRIRQGWTSDRTPAMQTAFDEMRAESDDVPDRLLWLKVESDEGKRLAMLRRPYPGWFPIPSPYSKRATKKDKAISRAYRALYVAMNPGIDERVILGGKRSGPKTVVPPDGDYILEGGVMNPAMLGSALSVEMLQDARDIIQSGRMPSVTTDKHGISAQDVTQAIDEIAGEMLRGGTKEGRK